MKARGAIVQGTLATLGLLGAYATWQREPDHAAGEAVVIDVNRNDIGMIRYQDGSKWVELERRAPKGGLEDEPAVWLHVSATETPKVPERWLRGNDSATKLFDRFAPLRAVRALGTLPADKQKELGLEGSKKVLQVKSKRGETRFVVGNSPLNVSDPYVLNEADKRVYVLGSGLISELDGASFRLIDRTLHAFKTDEIQTVTVKSPESGKSREFVQTGGANPATVKFAPKSAPAKPEEMVKNWHEKVWRLYGAEILGEGEKPAAGEPQPLARIDYGDGHKPIGFLEVGRVTAAPLASGGAGTVDYYARTEHTAGWIKLAGSVDELVKELPKIISGS